MDINSIHNNAVITATKECSYITSSKKNIIEGLMHGDEKVHLNRYM